MFWNLDAHDHITIIVTCTHHTHAVCHSQRRHLLAAHRIVHQQTGTVMRGEETETTEDGGSNRGQQ